MRARPLKELVLEEVALAHVFERNGIDYCCNGDQTLEAACATKGLNVDAMLQEIEMTKAARPYSFLHCDLWDLEFLIEYIVENHHRYSKATIPVLLSQLSKLRASHGHEFSYITPVAMLFERVSHDIEQHMRKEEMILFPYIKTLASAAELGGRRPLAPFLTVEGPVGTMEKEHIETAQIFSKIRALLSDFIIPDHACTMHRAVITGMQAFIKDMHQHVHLENNLLFPRARDIERAFDQRLFAPANTSAGNTRTSYLSMRQNDTASKGRILGG